MKYFVECPNCGGCYETEGDRVPSSCDKCGHDTPKVTLHNTKTRLRALAAMRKMDELKPRILEARKAYMELMAEYELECQIIRGYSRRGIVTPEEKDRYMIRKSEALRRVTLEECMKEYWDKRRENDG